MIANTIFAAGAFASLVAAIPMAQVQQQKRDIVWETHTEIAVTTIPVTVTHWLQPGESAPTDAPFGKQQHWGHGGHHGYGHGHSGYGAPAAQPETTESVAQPETTEPAAPVAPASSPESTPEAPAPSSSEQPATQQAPAPAYTAPAEPSTTTTTQAPAPEPTTTWEAPATPATTTPETTEAAPAPETTTAAAASPSYGSGSSSAPANGLSGMAAAGSSYSGDITYWTPALGACGWTNDVSEPVVAIGTTLFDQYTPASGNPNLNTLCGKYVSITGTDGSATKAKIVDRCGGCAETDLDLSPSLFKTVAPNGDGRVSGVDWMFM